MSSARLIDVEFDADDGITLAGTVTFPPAQDGGVAAPVLSGSGPLDRNSDTSNQALGISKAIAEALAAAGVATLRFDKRGVGESGGHFASCGFHDEAADAAAALGALRNVAGVGPLRIGVVGHSVGRRARRQDCWVVRLDQPVAPRSRQRIRPSCGSSGRRPAQSSRGHSRSARRRLRRLPVAGSK